MKRFTLLLAMCFIAFSGPMMAQNKSNSIINNPRQQSTKLPAAYQKATNSPDRETSSGIKNSDISIDFQNVQIPFLGAYGPAARPDGTEEFGENLIFTSGPYINKDPNLSIAENVSNGIETWGFSSNKNSDRSLAEEIKLPMDFEISSIDLYAYQTGATPPSITGVYIQIWDGDPSSGTASVVWGDFNNNILADVDDTGVYRVLEDDQSNTERKIQKVKANTAGLSLSTGTYWVEYTMEGSGGTSPFTPPISVLGETITGNALQNTPSGWQAVTSAPNDDPQGLPLQIYGVADLGGNSCAEINPPYDWYFKSGYRMDTSSNNLVANDITLAAGDSFTLKNVTALLASEWPITEMNVTYYEDNNGVPGNSIGSENSVTIDASNAIGSLLGIPYNVYEVKATVDPFMFMGQMNNEATYWIGVNATNSQGSVVYWVYTEDHTVGNPLAKDNGSGWEEYKPGLDGLYVWSGDCSPVLGIDENQLTQFRVYPNPTKDVLYLETSKNFESISLYNLLGQEVLMGEIGKRSTEISLADLPVGTYILKTTVEGQVETRKIIKK